MSGSDPKRTLGPVGSLDFRTIQADPKDLPGPPHQADGAVD